MKFARLDVLIVEDDPELRADLRVLLSREGYVCADAADGDEAMEIARQSPPRLAILDMMMPGLDGLALAQALRADPRTKDVHVYMLTARNDREMRRAARQAGCEVFLSKPVEIADLLETISLGIASESIGERPMIRAGQESHSEPRR